MTTRKRDLYNGKLLALQPRLAKLDWTIERCRSHAGSAQHGDLVELCKAALAAGAEYERYTRMLAYQAGAAMCRSDAEQRISDNWERSAPNFSLAEHKAIQLLNKLFPEQTIEE